MKFYITTAIPYVNAKPHIGHALEFIQSDVVARYHKLLGDDVLKLCGGDENALKNVQAAEKAGRPIQEFIDENEKYFLELTEKLNCHYEVWQKGSNQETHFPSSQKLWELCDKNGDIYQKTYTGLYCVGCETFYEKGELNEHGECSEHPGKKLDEVSEENYFFKLSRYRDQLIKLVRSDKLEIVPTFRKNEILSFLKNDLRDISISRSNERAKNWGVPVPGDDKQRIYVWFDALNIYQSGIGFGWDEQNYKKWWPADVHVIGKGIIRFHAVYWPAFLLSAGLELPKKLFVHEYFTVNGQKMSKTLGNVYDPVQLLDKLTPILGDRLSADVLRYFCLAKISPFQDGDFSEEKLFESYKSDLQNGLGNLIARVAKLCENSDFITSHPEQSTSVAEGSISSTVNQKLSEFKFNEALDDIWSRINNLNGQINIDEPWKLDKSLISPILSNYVQSILQIAIDLTPFLPETAKTISAQFSNKIKSHPPLFPKLLVN